MAGIFVVLWLKRSYESPTPDIIAAHARESTVQIRALDAKGAVVGQGSGFFLSADGVIATNLHVLQGATNLQIYTATNEIYDLVYFITADERHDIAILKIPIDKAPALPLAERETVVGDKVYAMGNPLGQIGTFSDGLLSAERTLEGVSLLQITAPISAGSSGGPVMNARGEVIGVATLMLSGGQNLNYAVPAKYVRPLVRTAESPRRFDPTVLPTATTDAANVSITRSSAEPSPVVGGRPRGGSTDYLSQQFWYGDSVLRANGYEPVGNLVRGSLELADSASHQVTLRAQVSYALLGRCDQDCTDLDFVLESSYGTRLAEDLKFDDKPTLLFDAPYDGTFLLRVKMAECSVGPCTYGIRLYRLR